MRQCVYGNGLSWPRMCQRSRASAWEAPLMPLIMTGLDLPHNEAIWRVPRIQ